MGWGRGGEGWLSEIVKFIQDPMGKGIGGGGNLFGVNEG